MSKLTLFWRECGKERSYTIDLNDPDSKVTGTIRLGRDPRCDVVLHDPRISGVHAEITFNPSQGNFCIQNLRESNPILVNDQQLIQGSEILPMERLSL